MTVVQIMQMQQKTAKKLMAAIAMLLVAAILMGVTTYAWVTISTAPEVSNINTTIGGNGYLEIALQSTDPTTQRRAIITSGRGDSSAVTGKSLLEANKHWGNIIDLNNLYGFESMVIYPSALYVDDSNHVNLSHPVKSPVFGDDGRIVELSEVNKARYTENGFTFNTNGDQYAGSDYGVNMLGYFYEGQKPDSQTVTVYDRKTVVSNMITEMNNSRDSLQEAIQSIMLNYSGNIYKLLYYVLYNADIAFQQQDSNGTYAIELDENDRNQIKNMLDELEDVADDAYESLRYSLMAYAAADMTGYPDTDAGRRALGGLFTSYSQMNTTAIKSTATEKGYSEILSAASEIEEMISRISNAKSRVDSDIMFAINFLINYQFMSVDGQTVSISDPGYAREHLIYGMKNGAHTSDGTGATTNRVSFWKDSGVFASLASIIGDYSGQFHEDSFGIQKQESVIVPFPPFEMIRTTDVVAPHEITTNIQVTSKNSANQYEPLINVGLLGNVSASVSTKLNSTTGTIDVNEATTKKMSTYGFMIDLAFRSNEEGALKLQSQPTDRITGEEIDNDYINEHGEKRAAVQGSGSNVSFTLDGGLNANNADRLIRQIYLVFCSTQSGRIYGIATVDNIVVLGTKATGDLVLHDPVFNEAGMLQPGIVSSNQAIISNMTPDKEEYVSVIFYLNASNLDSSMLGYNGTASLNGSINLQFAHGGETLIPLNYNGELSIKNN